MTAPDEPYQPNAPGEDSRLIPPAGETPDAAASELVVHGLLEFINRNDHAAAERRVARVMQSLAPESSGRVFPFRRFAKWGLAVAAFLAIATVAVIISVSAEPSALAAVQQSIAAIRKAGDQRYEVRVLAGDDTESGAAPRAIMDMRTPGLVILRHLPPHATDYVVVGRDAKGLWSIQEDGHVERDQPEGDWPPWTMGEGESLFTEPVDRMLEGLPDYFTLKRETNAALEGDSRTYDHIIAMRNKRAGPEAPRVDLWIDPETRLVERIVFDWLRNAKAPSADIDQNRDERPPPPPRGDRPDRPPDGRRDRPPPGDHGPGGPDGPGGHGPRGPGKRISMIIFQRVDAPRLPDNWFTPEGHGGHE